MWGLCNLRPARELGRETRAITPISFLSLTHVTCSHCATCAADLQAGSELLVLGIDSVLQGTSALQSAWTAVEFPRVG